VERYHGVDVDREMIEFLSSNVNDPRFTYKHIDVHNERYHRAGKPLSRETNIGAEGQTFDGICVFSVFTHLAPANYRVMLDLARKYVSPTGKLVFTSFIDDTISGDFRDFDPSKPLFKALYRESVVRDMATAANWSVDRIFQPGAQHWIVCNPI
jgi:cyclopropane fatty-acyl-phospholipid synthase-like methyltransferase